MPPYSTQARSRIRGPCRCRNWTPPLLADALVILLLVLFNGALALSEIAIVSSRRGRLAQMADTGSAGARRALALAAEPTRFLSSVEVGIDGARNLDTVVEALQDDSFLDAAVRQHYHTLGGVAMVALRRVPRTDDVFERAGYRFEIVDMDGNRVDRVLVSRRAPPGGTAPPSID